MSGIAKRNCPYCKTQSVAFTAKTEWVQNDNEKRALFICGACKEGVIWSWLGNTSLLSIAGNIEQFNIMLFKQWPEPSSGSAPADTPEVPANYFQQGTTAFECGSFDAAGMMFRKTLESATKILDPDLGKKPLIARIDKLVEQGSLTKDMGSWAHEVRLGGNDAAHEEEPFTAGEAQDLRNFIENFLRYAFTLPAAVQRRLPSNSE